MKSGPFGALIGFIITILLFRILSLEFGFPLSNNSVVLYLFVGLFVGIFLFGRWKYDGMRFRDGFLIPLGMACVLAALIGGVRLFESSFSLFH